MAQAPINPQPLAKVHPYDGTRPTFEGGQFPIGVTSTYPVPNIMGSPTLDQFVTAARALPENKGVPDDALTLHWNQNYGSPLGNQPRGLIASAMSAGSAGLIQSNQPASAPKFQIFDPFKRDRPVR